MPFRTRDFEALFGMEYGTVQFMAINKHLPTEGPPPKGRGSRRHYGLDAAFQIGLTARLRSLSMGLEKCHTIAAFLRSLFDTLTRDGEQNPGPLHLHYHPFRSLDETASLFFLELIILFKTPAAATDIDSPQTPEEYSWITLLQSSPHGGFFRPAPYIQVTGNKRDQPGTEEVMMADTYLRLNLTALTRQLAHFVKTNPRRFVDDSYYITF